LSIPKKQSRSSRRRDYKVNQLNLLLNALDLFCAVNMRKKIDFAFTLESYEVEVLSKFGRHKLSGVSLATRN